MSAAEMAAALDAELAKRPEMGAFKKLKPRFWVSFEKEPIRQFVQFDPARHNAYHSAWGFALAFCPSLKGDGKLTWRRTEKATRRHLWFDPIDNPPFDPRYRISYSTISSDPKTWAIVNVEPELSRVSEVVGATIAGATKLFGRVQSFKDMCGIFPELPSPRSQRFGPDNYTPHGLAWGLTLIAAGDKAAAEKRIQRWCKQHKVNNDDRILRAAIELAGQYGSKPEYLQ